MKIKINNFEFAPEEIEAVYQAWYKNGAKVSDLPNYASNIGLTAQELADTFRQRIALIYGKSRVHKF